jgi:demethylmenaquinone methyltransferase/2-methoxy-6-polyprenyl-1,4-benzoquinol methylase
MNLAKTKTSSATTSPGACPVGATGEQDASRRVRGMFSHIAPRYDFLNHLLSFSMDRMWRRRVASRLQVILTRPDSVALDICCGTGDLLMALLKRSRGVVFGSDFAHPMLVRATRKFAVNESLTKHLGGFVEADALSLPFPGNTFDLLTVAFGFRNLANYESGLREILRVLRPGGEVGILEFSAPRGRVFPALHRFYFRNIVPRLGGAISGDRSAYAYLPDSVDHFPSAEGLAEQMVQAGFRAPTFELWMGGSVALHRGAKP